MRVALCISGQVRPAWRESFVSCKQHIIDPLTPDVFLSSWADDEGQYLELREMSRAYNCKLAETESHVLAHLNMYSTFKHPPNIDRYTFWPMFHSIYKANHLKSIWEQMFGFRYDVVIRIRSDILIDRNIDQSSLDEACKANYVLSFSKNDRYNPDDPTVADQFALGSSDTMDKYSSVFFILPQVMESLKRLEGYNITNEALLCEGLHLLGVEYKTFKKVFWDVHPNRF